MLSLPFFILFPLAIYGIHRLFPFRRSAGYTPPSYEQIDKYNSWSKISAWVIILFMGLSIYLISGPLYDYRINALMPGSDAVFYVLPDRMTWGMICWIPVLGMSAFVYTLGTKLYLGNDYQGFVDYYCEKVRYNPFRAMIPICGGFVMIGLALMFCVWNYSVYSYRNKMVIHWFLSVNEKVYTYQQVKSVEFTPETQKHGAQYSVTFKDGMDWNSPGQLYDPNAATDFSFISKQSGVKIDTVAVDPL